MAVIDLGFIPNGDTEVVVDYGHVSSQPSYAVLYGTTNSSGGAQSYAFYLGCPGSTEHRIDYDIFVSGIGYPGYRETWSVGTKYLFHATNTGFYQNGVLKGSYSSATFTSPANMLLYARNVAGNIDSNHAKGKVYSFRKLSGVSIYLPVLNNTTQKYGMYNITTNTFYGNVLGRGEFSGG